MVQSWLHFFSQDPLLISGVSLLTCIVQITGDIPFCHQHCQNFDTIIKSWRQAIFFFDFPMYEILCPFLYAGISQFFLRSSLSVSKGFSSVPAQVLLNLCVMHFTYTSALLRLIKTRWNKEGVMTGILVQPVIFSADRVLLPQNWSYYLAHIRIVKLIQLDCCAQRDRPLL